MYYFLKLQVVMAIRGNNEELKRNLDAYSQHRHKATAHIVILETIIASLIYNLNAEVGAVTVKILVEK